MARVPSYQKTTALVSRALALAPEALVAGFVPATQVDLPQIVALRKQVIGPALVWDDLRYLTWRYHCGSAEQGRGECWVLKRGADVLAMVGSEVISVLHQGRAVSGLSAMDIAVRPDLEGVGLGVWMAMRLCEQFDCVLVVGSNANSRALVLRVFERLPDRRSYAHLIEFKATFQRRFKPAWLAGCGAALARWGMAGWRGAVAFTQDRSVQIEPLMRFDESVNRLVTQSQSAHEVSLDRSAQFLNWRLFDNPRSAYSVWAARDVEGLAGYIAVHIKLAEDGSKVLVIEDFLVRGGGQGAAVLRSLLCRAFAHALAESCERVSVIACHIDNERVLRRLGFFAHRADAETLSVRCRDAHLSEAIAAGVPWHLTGANTDRDD